MERPTDFNKEMARPALHDVNDLAKKYQDSRAEIERLRMALGECLDEFAHRAFDSPQASHRGNAEMMKVCGAALGKRVEVKG